MNQYIANRLNYSLAGLICTIAAQIDEAPHELLDNTRSIVEEHDDEVEAMIGGDAYDAGERAGMYSLIYKLTKNLGKMERDALRIQIMSLIED
jgi:hypothetical protein